MQRVTIDFLQRATSEVSNEKISQWVVSNERQVTTPRKKKSLYEKEERRKFEREREKGRLDHDVRVIMFQVYLNP